MITQEEVQAAILVRDRLCQLIKEYGDDRCSLDLLMFLAKHPHTRFSRMAIAHAIDAQRLNIDRPLRHLIKDGLVKMWVENGLALYSLTEDGSLCDLVSQLVNLDWYKWQLILKQPLA
ncbi:MAG: hypothetical protein HYX81_05065 [Chloroflexi bacterium]|nr:hypothetical protein [Chloroflexota bacterium]